MKMRLPYASHLIWKEMEIDLVEQQPLTPKHLFPCNLEAAMH